MGDNTDTLSQVEPTMEMWTHQHYVGVASLSVFRGNFVLAKVRQGLTSVRRSELRGVCFLEVRNVLVLW